ncbi:MAG: ABC transporter ATP-binding protein [Alphaproteobacteria bacterium]|nr:ABC transporter ATP-binding protein [Alphaproteobacteria bacterium]
MTVQRQDGGAAIGIEVVAMTKRFGDMVALDAVDLRVRPGAVHALLGENGAGKSTLVKCVMGFYRCDEGGVIVEGHEVSLDNPKAAHALGIGMVYQHFTLVPSMTVLENLVMSRSDVPAVVDWAAERRRVAAFMADMPFSVPLDRPASRLAAGEKQKVEILKQLYLRSRFLILDEPTSVLTPQEGDEMLGLLRGMAQAKRLTVLIITHKFREVLAFADDVSVLRQGRLVGSGPVAELGVDAMARMMIGDDKAASAAIPRADLAPGPKALDIRGLRAEGLDDVSFSVRGGEIVGIAGVSGNGQSELVEVLSGQSPATGGEIRVFDQPYGATRREMLRHKVGLLPEEPLRNACVGKMSVAENMAFRSFDDKGWWLDRDRIARAARGLIERYRVKTASPDAPIASLSGGNVQRAVLARELCGDVAILIAANPVFGLDFAAVADIHGQIVEARNRGVATLLVSEDLDELLELADRILVMSNGRIVHETHRDQADRTTIGRRMAGH